MISHDQVELDRLKFHQVGFAKQDPGTPYQLDRNVQTLYNINIIYTSCFSQEKKGPNPQINSLQAQHVLKRKEAPILSTICHHRGSSLRIVLCVNQPDWDSGTCTIWL